MHSLADASGYMRLRNKCTAIAQAGVLHANSCRRAADGRRWPHLERRCKTIRNLAAVKVIQAAFSARFVEVPLERNCAM